MPKSLQLEQCPLADMAWTMYPVFAAVLLQVTRALKVVQFSSADTLVGGHGPKNREKHNLEADIENEEMNVKFK